MKELFIYLPAFLMVLLSMMIVVRLFTLRWRGVQSGSVPLKFYSIYVGGSESEEAIKASRHFGNLFETPVLFYLFCVLCLHFGVVNNISIGLCWVYVGLRYVHAWIHVFDNNLRLRIYAFFSSVAVLSLMWLYLTATLIMSL